MQNDAGGGEVARDGKPRFGGLFVDEKLIVIPAEASAHRPASQVEEILDECGLLEIRPLCGEGERERCSVVEMRGIGDDVARAFVKEDTVGLHTGPQLASAPVGHDQGLEVAFAEAVVLEDLYGDRLRI